MPAELSDQERERYAEQIERIGPDAQLRLRGARAIVIGARAAGSAAAAHLASSGVGYVGVVDGAQVTLADLTGQSVLYTPDLGSNRADAVAAKLGLLNTGVHAESYPVEVDEQNAGAIVMGHDVALDCAAEGDHLAAGCAAAEVELLRADGDDIRAGADAAGAAIELLIARVPTEATS
jgi:molybdopterin-synthase adenylyltransferase